jgi:hypothetical protein
MECDKNFFGWDQEEKRVDPTRMPVDNIKLLLFGIKEFWEPKHQE